MERTISSAQTLLMKVVFPPLWIGGFASATLAMFLQEPKPPEAMPSAPSAEHRRAAPMPRDAKWGFLAATLLGSAFIYWGCVRLKKVSLSDDSLIISNYLRSERVPLTELSKVTENVWINIHPVTLHFRNPTAFGSRVVFMPTVRAFGFFSNHPIVRELRDAALMAQRAAGWQTGPRMP